MSDQITEKDVMALIEGNMQQADFSKYLTLCVKKWERLKVELEIIDAIVCSICKHWGISKKELIEGKQYTEPRSFMYYIIKRQVRTLSYSEIGEIFNRPKSYVHKAVDDMAFFVEQNGNKHIANMFTVVKKELDQQHSQGSSSEQLKDLMTVIKNNLNREDFRAYLISCVKKWEVVKTELEIIRDIVSSICKRWGISEEELVDGKNHTEARSLLYYVIKLELKNISYGEIAELFDRRKSYVHKIVTGLFEDSNVKKNISVICDSIRTDLKNNRGGVCATYKTAH